MKCASRRSSQTFARKKILLLSPVPPYVFTKDEQCTSRLASLRCGSLFTETVTFFRRLRVQISASARATDARHDGSSRTDNAGRRWRPRPAEAGRKWPRTGRVARERITCDDRRSRDCSVLARDTDASRAYVSKAFSGGVYALESCK